MNIPNINSNGWYENGDILWVKKIFPEDMSDILLHPIYDPNIDINDDGESDDEQVQ